MIEVYSSIECPYAYLAVFRLRQVRRSSDTEPEIVWRALSLEYVNEHSYPKPLYDAQFPLFKKIEPELPWKLWKHPEWKWTQTYWPAHEALACAQAQGIEASFEMSWALRHAYFAENRCLSLRHELMDIARQLAGQGYLNLTRFKQDWDEGRYKAQVLEESHHGWHELKLEASATLVLSNGERITNPAVGEIDFDEENYRLLSYTSYPGDPVEVYRQIPGLV